MVIIDRNGKGAIMRKIRVVILGGGFAGAFTAKYLSRHKLKNIEIELINETNYFVFQPLLPEVASGTISAPDAVTPLRIMLPGVKVRMASVKGVDFSHKTIRLVQGSQRVPIDLPYDHLVITAGQRTDLSRVPGMTEHGFIMRNLADAYRLRNHVIQCLEHADVTTNAELKQRLLTFVVAGGGFSGVETVGELIEMIRRTLKYYPNVSKSDVRAVLVQRGNRLLPELPERLGYYTQRKLAQRGVDVRLGCSISTSTAYAVVFDDGSQLQTATVISTVGNAVRPLIQQLGIELRHGKIPVNACLQIEGLDNVWAAGDVASIPMPPKNGEPANGIDFAPPTAQFAVREARLLARNLLAMTQGKSLLDFRYTPKGSLASIGNYKGVAEVFGLRLSGLFAWLLWRGFYIAMIPGFATKLRIALNWFFDYFLPRNIVQIKTDTPAGTRFIRLAKGDVLFKPGQLTDGFYTVVEGKLELRVSPDREDQTEFIRVYQLGDHWGERLINSDAYMPGTLRALQDSKILVLSGSDFDNLKKALPVVGAYFEQADEQQYAPSLRCNSDGKVN